MLLDKNSLLSGHAYPNTTRPHSPSNTDRQCNPHTHSTLAPREATLHLPPLLAPLLQAPIRPHSRLISVHPLLEVSDPLVLLLPPTPQTRAQEQEQEQGQEQATRDVIRSAPRPSRK